MSPSQRCQGGEGAEPLLERSSRPRRRRLRPPSPSLPLRKLRALRPPRRRELSKGSLVHTLVVVGESPPVFGTITTPPPLPFSLEHTLGLCCTSPLATQSFTGCLSLPARRREREKAAKSQSPHAVAPSPPPLPARLAMEKSKPLSHSTEDLKPSLTLPSPPLSGAKSPSSSASGEGASSNGNEAATRTD